MRLHRLRLAALGPFAAEHEIDLTRVSAGGLFLLEGPTGAGKSTILDAITFALYGGVAGRGTSKDRLHSDFSSELDPLAELDFSMGGNRYRIRRTPTFERVKRDGSGTTVVNAKVWLWRLNLEASGEFSQELISNRVREADDEVRRLLGGLSLEQFCQVVVLPQGEFATFLRADAEQRRDVLQRLFATDHYQHMERIAAEQRQIAQREIAQENQLLRDAVVSLRQAVGELAVDVVADVVADEPPPVAAIPPVTVEQGDNPVSFDVDQVLGLSDDERNEWIHDTEAQAKAAYERAIFIDADAQSELEAARTAHDALVATHERNRERIEHEQERVRLASMAEQMAALVDERDRAIRVQALVPMFDERDRIAAQLSAAMVEGQQQQALVGDEHVRSLPATPRSADVLSLVERLRGDHAQLTLALAVEKGLEQQRDMVQSAIASQLSHNSDVAVLAELVATLPARLAELVKQRDELRALSVRAPDLALSLTQAQERLRSWQRLPILDAEVVALDEQRRAAIDSSQQAREALQQATAHRLAGMAAELASTLEAGQACMVCGSTDHPVPAVATGVRVSEDQLDELSRIADQAAQWREEAQTSLSAKIVERERCRADAGQQDPSQDVQRLTLEVAQAQSAVQELPRHDAACEQAQHELDQARTALSAAELNLAVAVERIANLTEEVAASEAAIDAARADFDTVADRSQALTAAISAAQQWARSCAQVEALDQNLAAVSHALDAAARDAGCRDVDEARQAIRHPADLQASTERIAEHARLSAVNAAALDGFVDSAPQSELPNVDASAHRLAAAAMKADDARALLTSTQNTVKDVSHCVSAIAAAARSIVEVNAKAAPTIRVADALGGLGRVNSRRMTLSTYVLRERFASVVDAASRRLDRMSDGRYVMERDEAVSGNRRAGLGLVVLDQWNGSRRDPRTLSGGESFYASLSLALGLADVVRDEVGGVELETLFIDEGFGSLDPQTLESVLGVIDSLRDGGRVVGIVSHVNELKERIPDRIEVRRRADGSSTVSIRAT